METKRMQINSIQLVDVINMYRAWNILHGQYLIILNTDYGLRRNCALQTALIWCAHFSFIISQGGKIKNKSQSKR